VISGFSGSLSSGAARPFPPACRRSRSGKQRRSDDVDAVLGGDGGQPGRVRDVVTLAGGGCRELLEPRAVVRVRYPVLAPSYARVLDLGSIVLVPVTGLYLDLVVLWRRGDLSPALRHFLTVIGGVDE
jgi:hypothetical protein